MNLVDGWVAGNDNTLVELPGIRNPTSDSVGDHSWFGWKAGSV